MTDHLTEAQEREITQALRLAIDLPTAYEKAAFRKGWLAKADATTSAESEVGTGTDEQLDSLADAYRWDTRDGRRAMLRAALAARPVAQPDAGVLGEKLRDLAMRGLLGVIGTARAQAARIIAPEGDADDLRQDKRDLPDTLRVIASAVESLAASTQATQASSAVGAEWGIRDAFSRWATLEKNLNTRIRTAPFRAGEYADESCNLAWDAWQAALATPPAIPVAAEAPAKDFPMLRFPELYPSEPVQAGMVSEDTKLLDWLECSACERLSVNLYGSKSKDVFSIELWDDDGQSMGTSLREAIRAAMSADGASVTPTKTKDSND